MRGFETFQRDKRKELQRIARDTNGEMEAGDLISEAFLLTMEIEEKTGHVLDLALTSDQEILIRWLYARFVKYADKILRYSVKLDAGWDDDSEEMPVGAKLASRLAASETEDPLAQHVIVEDQQDQIEAVQVSYSEASAYTLLLIDWSWDFKGLAADLLLGGAVVRGRVPVEALAALHPQPAPVEVVLLEPGRDPPGPSSLR